MTEKNSDVISIENIKKISQICINACSSSRILFEEKHATDYKDISQFKVHVYMSLVESIQILNNKGYFKEVKNLYSEVCEYIPESNKKLRNILLNEYEIADGATHLKSFPRHIQFVMTMQCNLNCIMCSEKHENVFATDKELDDLIAIMPYLQMLTLRGGEVFYDKRTGHVLDEAYKNDVRVTIVTNGLLFNEEIIKKILRTAGGIIFSIDSPFKETYEAIRNGAKFEDLIQNLKIFKKLRENEKKDVRLTLNMVVMRKNCGQIEDMLHFAKEYGFDSVVLAPVEGKVKGKNENFFEQNKDFDLIKKIDAKKDFYMKIADMLSIELINKLPGLTEKDDFENDYSGKSVKSSDCNKTASSLFCYAPFRQMFKPIGSYKPLCCCNDTETDINSDNARNSILECWNGKNMVSYREKMLRHNYKDCVEVCLSAKEDTFEGKKILLWEV